MKSRYCYCPMAGKKIGRRVTIMERFRRWKSERKNRRNAQDYYTFIGYNAPVLPGKIKSP